MKIRPVSAAKVAATALLIAAAARGGSPALIHYQGRLLDTTGTPVNGSVSIAVGLYSNVSSGAAVFTQSIGAVAAVNGMFEFGFGTNTLAFLSAFTNDSVWVGVSVGGEALTPRQRLMAVPYALTADRVPDLMLATTGTAAGVGADARDSGVAVGYQAKAYSVGFGLGGGAAVGQSSEAFDYGAGLGFEASGFSHGVAAGYQALGYDHGVAVGNQSYAAGTNVAVGVGAAASGVNRTAIGPWVISEADHSTAVRGSLYLDGATGVFHRAAFGSGAWKPGLPGGWSGVATNISGTRTQLMFFASGVLTNLVIQ